MLTGVVSEFLVDVVAQKGRWRESAAAIEDVSLHYYWTGQGRDALEVALASSSRALTSTEARSLWSARQRRSAAPLLTVVLYQSGDQVRAVACGPSGDSPTVVDLDAEQAERLAAAALRETNRHHAAALVRTAMEQASEE